MVATRACLESFQRPEIGINDPTVLVKKRARRNNFSSIYPRREGPAVPGQSRAARAMLCGLSRGCDTQPWPLPQETRTSPGLGEAAAGHPQNTRTRVGRPRGTAQCKAIPTNTREPRRIRPHGPKRGARGLLDARLLPSSLCYDHLRPHFVKFQPQLPLVQKHFDSFHALQGREAEPGYPPGSLGAPKPRGEAGARFAEPGGARWGGPRPDPGGAEQGEPWVGSSVRREQYPAALPPP